MESLSTDQRINYYDIAKGLGIICVVYAHASAPFCRYISLFHMPLFFLISGLLYNGETSISTFVKKKFFRLYVPFAFWNILIYFIKSVYTGVDGKTIFLEVMRIALTLSKDGQFFGATWFLGALFAVSILYKAIDAKLPESRIKDITLLIIFGTLAFMGIEINLKYMLSRTLILSSYFSVGAFLKKRKAINTILGKEYAIVAIACFAIFVVMGQHNTANMGKNEYKYPMMFIVGAFFASYAVIYLCSWLDDYPKKTVEIKGAVSIIQKLYTNRVVFKVINLLNKQLIFWAKIHWIL